MRFFDIVSYIDNKDEITRYSNRDKNKVDVFNKVATKGDIIKVLLTEASDYELNLWDAMLLITKIAINIYFLEDTRIAYS